MIKVNRRAYLEHTTPEAIFATLSDPNGIAKLLPRMQKVDLLDRDDVNCKARLVTHMSLGGIFGTIRCEGDLTWVEPREILFKVRTPVPVETRWVLTSAVNGADIQATMTLDLTPMLGPMAAFVPTQQVAEILAAELDAALKAITNKMRDSGLRERAVAA
ncbi:MAG: cyclase [Chloroflexales bacterium]|nr:cyclase [Chloroflexales bacterium]